MRSENLSGIDAPTLGRSCSKVTVLPTATRIREALSYIVNWLRRLYFIHVWRMQIGEGTIISFGATLDKTYPQGVHIGKNSVVAVGAAVLTHDWANGRVSNIYIGDNCLIGPKAIVLPGVMIEDNCVVGPSSVVARDVPAGSHVAGNPARIVARNSTN